MPKGLEGIKIIDASSFLAAPMATRILADWGADVITIENVSRGTRFAAPKKPAAKSEGKETPSAPEIDYSALNRARNKRSITLDIGKPEGRKVIDKLVETADIFVCNFRPREVEKFNLDYATLSKVNPRLIYGNMTGFGKNGPARNLPAFETSGYWTRPGLVYMMNTVRSTDYQPYIHGGTGDHVATLAFACGLMAALFIRERTGEGQEVSASLYRAGIFILSSLVARTLATGWDQQPVIRKIMPNPRLLSSFFKTKDNRWFNLNVTEPDRYWARICQAIERPDLASDPRFESLESIQANMEAIYPILDEVFLTRTLAEWTPRFDEVGLPWSPMQNLTEVVNDPQARENECFVSFDHPTHGRIELVGSPVLLSKTPITIRSASPEFGQNTEEVLLEYGYSWEDIIQFKEQGVIV